jgi:hypothetical protein
LPVGQQLSETVFVEDGHAEFDGFFVFRSRRIAGDDVVGFFDTEPAAFPPRVRTASFASSRQKPASEPVTTIVRLSSVRGTLASRSSAIGTPADRHLSTVARCQSTVNHWSAIAGGTRSCAES